MAEYHDWNQKVNAYGLEFVQGLDAGKAYEQYDGQELDFLDFGPEGDSIDNALEKIKLLYPGDKIYFANGGDRNKKNIPRFLFCKAIFRVIICSYSERFKGFTPFMILRPPPPSHLHFVHLGNTYPCLRFVFLLWSTVFSFDRRRGFADFRQ